MADASSSGSSSDDSDEELTPGEQRRRAELRELKAAARERRLRDAAIRNASCTIRLVDKGTRRGCELWISSGVIVTTKYCTAPCLLTTHSAIPDPYHAAHATV